MKMLTKTIRILSITLIIAFLSGCTAFDILSSKSFEEPSFKYKRHKVGEPTEKYLPVVVEVEAFNPNDFGISNTYIQCELSYKGRVFMKSDDIALELIPNSPSKILVPLEFNYKNVLKTGGKIAEKILSGKRSVKLKARVALKGSPTIYDANQQSTIIPFEISLLKTIKVKIPRDKIEDALDGNAKTMYRLARKGADLERKLKKLKRTKDNIEKLGKLF